MTKTEEYLLAQGRKPMGQMTCQECGVLFSIFKRQDLTRKKFCSVHCARVVSGHRIQQRIKDGLLPSPHTGRTVLPKEERRCEKCGGVFLISPIRKGHRRKRFCSFECSLGMQKGKFVGDKSPVWTERVTIKCEACGTDFQDYAARKKRMKTCSKECANKLLERPAIHTCKHCGKKTESTVSRARTQKYCSRRCLFEAIPSFNTSIERKVKELLKDIPDLQHGYPFEGFMVDFAIPSKRLFIECDGTYWHSLPAAKRRDFVKDRLAAEQGWTMLRLTEREINEDIARCHDKIKRALGVSALEEPPVVLGRCESVSPHLFGLLAVNFPHFGFSTRKLPSQVEQTLGGSTPNRKTG